MITFSHSSSSKCRANVDGRRTLRACECDARENENIFANTQREKKVNFVGLSTINYNLRESSLTEMSYLRSYIALSLIRVFSSSQGSHPPSPSSACFYQLHNNSPALLKYEKFLHSSRPTFHDDECNESLKICVGSRWNQTGPNIKTSSVSPPLVFSRSQKRRSRARLEYW